MKKAISLALAAVLLTSGSSAAAETAAEAESNKAEVSFSTDLVSSYLWRGQDLGGVSIQPGIGFSWRGLSLSAWGSSGFDEKDTKEVDLTLGYTWKGFTVSITDYWFDNGPGYFKYKAHDTAHVCEGHVGYDFGPVALNWYTNFAGNDGVTSKGKRAYSSYVEVSAPFSFKSVDFTAEVGASPYATSFYNATGFAVINIGLTASHEFTLSPVCSIKPYAKLAFNPRNDKAYMLAGVSFSVF